MMQTIGQFLQPRKMTMLVFLLLLVSVSVVYVYREPERTNYLPGEDQNWMIKSKIYPSIINEYFFHTDGNMDVLLGIIERDYGANRLGIPLVILYYILAAGVNGLVCSAMQRVGKLANVSSKKSGKSQE
jgi:hypothetical protein